MRTLRIAITLTAAAVLLVTASAQSLEVELQRATQKETVTGDLRAAIEEYRKVAARAGSNRRVAAQALIRMAECHQKLGDAESRKIYERVLRDYADQKDAVALARARLGGAETVARSRGDRPVWTGPNVDLLGTVSPDGRFLTYVDQVRTGNLVLRDLAAGIDRPLTDNALRSGWAGYSTISRDGRQVAYGWGLNDKRREELRIASLQGTAIPESRRVLGNEDVKGIAPYDWSPDGKWLAVHLRRQDLTGQIGLVAVQDGALRVLKSTDWRGPTKIFFSPDGRYIAYDLLVSDTSDDRHVFVLATDGSRETTAVAHPSRNIVMGWSPDAQQHLLFASDRTGRMALWALPFAEGKPQAAPKLVKSDIGSSWSLGVSTSGALYVFKGGHATYVQVAPIDLNAGKLLPAPAGAFQRFIGSGGGPDWSADGKYLAYRSCGPAAPCTLAIGSIETGQVRELHPKMAYLGAPRWSPDGRSFTTDGTDLKGRRGMYRIDAQTGDISSVMVPGPVAIAQWGAGEKKIYYRRDGGIVERDSTSGEEREMFRRRSDGNSISIVVSPDGRYIASVEYASKTSTLLLIPIAGGEPRELLRVSSPEGLDGYRLIWTPDNRAVILTKQLTADRDRKELWLVPVTGGQSRKLDIDVDNWVGFRLDPDGRRIAFVAEAGKLGSEIWALENFLPAPSAKR